MMRHLANAAACLVAGGCVVNSPPRSAGFAESLTASVSASALRGTLLIVGGGSQPDELVKHFVDLAGGRGKARTAILPMATSEAAPGVGFVHNAIVDQHFIRRQRENRLISVVLERPSLLGVGIDEGTALEVTPDGKWMVLGKSAVMILDARRSRTTSVNASVLGATDAKLSLLPAGSTYDPRTGEASLPGTR